MTLSAVTGDSAPRAGVLGLPHILEAYGRQDREALRQQRWRQGLAVVLVLLGPGAVLLLAAQVLWWSRGGLVGTVLIVGEVLLLVVAWATGILKLGEKPHQRWIRTRLRAELLRREAFLFRARVGPYLQASALDDVLGRRVREMESGGDQLDLISLREAGGATWQDTLEDARHRGRPVPAAEPGCLADYRRDRVAAQAGYYESKSSHCRHSDHRYELVMGLVLILAVVLAVVHLTLLASRDHASPDSPHQLEVWLIFWALVLPTIGSSIFAWRCLSQYHRLGRSYEEQIYSLNELAAALELLERAREQGTVAADEADFQFKRLVLRTETVLAHELREWWLIMHPEQPKGGA